jgi:hypothetical protein
MKVNNLDSVEFNRQVNTYQFTGLYTFPSFAIIVNRGFWGLVGSPDQNSAISTHTKQLSQ